MFALMASICTFAQTTITWTISGVNTQASGGKDVNTTLKTSSVVGGSGTWTAVASKSYAGSNKGAQLGSGSYPFNGTITLSESSIPKDAVITNIAITATTATTYNVSATVNDVVFCEATKIVTATKNSLSGSAVGNSIVLTFAQSGSVKNIILNSATLLQI